MCVYVCVCVLCAASSFLGNQCEFGTQVCSLPACVCPYQPSNKPPVLRLCTRRPLSGVGTKRIAEGGFVDQNEGLDAAARRELEEETGVTNCAMVQTGAYGGFRPCSTSARLMKSAPKNRSHRRGPAERANREACVLLSKPTTPLAWHYSRVCSDEVQPPRDRRGLQRGSGSSLCVFMLNCRCPHLPRPRPWTDRPTAANTSVHRPFLYAGDPGRDPRGHTITVAFMAWAPSRASCNARAGDDAAEARFFPVDRLPSLAFDHLKVRRGEERKRHGPFLSLIHI